MANFSIETDHTVLITFVDGEQERVSTRHLAKYLSPADTAKVRQALKLRQDFWRTHLPKTSLVVGLAASLLVIGLAGSGTMAELARHQRPLPGQTAVRPASAAAPASSTPAPAAPGTASVASQGAPGSVAGASTTATSASTATSPRPLTVSTPAVPTPSATPASLAHTVEKTVQSVPKLLGGLLGG